MSKPLDGSFGLSLVSCIKFGLAVVEYAFAEHVSETIDLSQEILHLVDGRISTDHAILDRV